MAVCACLGTTIGLSCAEAQIAASVNGVMAAQDVTGTFTVQRFISDGDRLMAVGLLGDVAAAPSSPARPKQTLRITVTELARSCETLRIDLGPVDLDLQGAPLHLNEFAILVSDPQRGPLTRSLCSIAGAPNEAASLAGRLNELVELVGCLMRGAGECSERAS